MSMNSKSYSWAIGLTFVSLSAACTGTTEGSSEGSSSGDLSATVSSLANAEDSFESAREAAKACFDAFRTCVEADGADLAACRATLTDCLPDEAPLPPRCGGDDDGDATADEGAEGGDEGDATEPPDGRRPPGADDGDGLTGPGFGFGGDGKDCDRPGDDDGGDGDGDSGDGDGDVGPGDGDGDVDTGDGDSGDGDGTDEPDVDVKIVRLDRSMGEGGVCERPDVPGDRFHGCRDEVTATLENGGSAEEARDAALACVGDAFEEHLAELCARAADFCAGDDAPAEICAKISEACASVSSGG
jgi:hypothetical protein